ncbi:hypothetical protein ACFOQM_06585 [Paenibacillus sp. GCM10012307]|uniref:DUF5668 domain-containing protein n=1 Tax=Paenibacillus roseus TaxID=2798579 RepID=A0A934J541_9BACL|nr:hypothetical protein [Paenibacillus roseus]MBJ6360966.1 hypothetical protein [Paenibacillus roseus]
MVKKAIIGPVLLLIGIYLFLNPGGSLSTGSIFAYFWPTIFVIPLGLFFHWMYFSMTGRRGIGLLIPGGILFTAGVVCQIAMLTGAWGNLWPGFILAVAVGLFEFYWFGNRNKWMLIPINILTVLSVLFFTVFSMGTILSQKVLGQPMLAVVLILAGAIIMMSKKRML